MDNETFSFVACFSNNYDHLNSLLDDTINDACCQVHAYATSNESFTYSQMLREEDHKQFLKQLKSNLLTTKFAIIGLSCNARTYLLEQRQSLLSGLLSVSGFPMGP
jgi:hypothetical protein